MFICYGIKGMLAEIKMGGPPVKSPGLQSWRTLLPAG